MCVCVHVCVCVCVRAYVSEVVVVGHTQAVSEHHGEETVPVGDMGPGGGAVP